MSINQFSQEYSKTRKEIVENLQKKDTNSAYRLVKNILDYPGPKDSESIFIDALNLFEKITSEIFGNYMSNLVKEVVIDPYNINNLYDLAYELYERGDNGIAATLLNRANNLDPNNYEIIIELAVNLEVLMLNGEACKILTESKHLIQENDFCRYLLAFNTIMTGNLDEALQIISTIESNPDENIRNMTKNVKRMLNRAFVLKKIRSLDKKDLRGWHMVLNGSILLHCSPFGLEDGMYGRYAYIADSYTLCKHGIIRVKNLLEKANIDIPYIFGLPDKSSQILAIATSKILKKPLVSWNEENLNKQGLIVAYDLDLIDSKDILIQISEHRLGQILWAHASCWTNPFPFSPDITTFLYQYNASPWGGQGMLYDKDSKEVKMIEPDNSSEPSLAEKIIQAEEEKNYLDDLDDLLSIIEPLKKLTGDDKPGLFKSSEKRLHQRAGSPVQSNRFL